MVLYSLEVHDSQAFRVVTHTGELFSRVALHRNTQAVYRFIAHASNDPRFHASSPLSVADVIVYVAHNNDNFPVMHRPQRTNETFTVRQLLTIGYAVTRVETTDADEAVTFPSCIKLNSIKTCITHIYLHVIVTTFIVCINNNSRRNYAAIYSYRLKFHFFRFRVDLLYSKLSKDVVNSMLCVFAADFLHSLFAQSLVQLSTINLSKWSLDHS